MAKKCFGCKRTLGKQEVPVYKRTANGLKSFCPKCGPKVKEVTSVGHDPKHVENHERGHEIAAKKLGCKTRRVYNSNGDLIGIKIISGPKLSPAEHAAVYLGGWMRAGRDGIEKDVAIAKSIAGSSYSAAKSLARKLVG